MKLLEKKSGKKTFGKGWFWNGCANKQERGLLFSVVALVDLDEKTTYTIDAKQVLPEAERAKDAPKTSTAQAVEQLEKNKEKFLSLSKILLVDGGYAKTTFLTPVCKLGFTIVGKMRYDANLRYLYDGAYSGQGAPKKYDGKVDWNDLSSWEVLETENARTYHKVVNSPAFKRNINIVRIHFLTDGKVTRRINLYSTDESMSAKEICQLYQHRFQIEFIFRDAKQHTGLAAGQIRHQQGLHHHWNLSLAATNLFRLEDRQWQREHAAPDTPRWAQVVSLQDWKRWKYNAFLLERFIDVFGIDPDMQLNQERIHDVLQTGLRFAS